jgi:hypothetical protein
MPPVSFLPFDETFMPDYELLVLCDQIVMDESSFHSLVYSPTRIYSGVAETFRALYAEGRVELVDFSSVLRANSDLLDKMLEHDLGMLDQWVLPLRESLTVWRQFAESSTRSGWFEVEQPFGSRIRYAHALHHGAVTSFDTICDGMHMVRGVSELVESALRSSEKRKRKEYRSALRPVVRAYLTYVNANLLLASELNIPFHDWLDFTPFYATKFLSVAKREEGTEQ